MGNRANVVFEADGQLSPAVYLHWNGGPECIYAFISEMQRRAIRRDACYDAARFVQLVGNFLDDPTPGGLSLGICNVPPHIDDTISFEDGLRDRLRKTPTDAGDNGFYVVAANYTVRRFVSPDGLEPVVELSDAEVARERKNALKSALFEEIRASIARIYE